MVYVPDAESMAFMGSLVHRFPALMPVLQEHLENQLGEMLPCLLMSDVCRWLVLRFVEHGPGDDLLLSILGTIDCQYGRSASVDNLIAACFLEALPSIGETGEGIRSLIGARLNEQLRHWDGGETPDL